MSVIAYQQPVVYPTKGAAFLIFADAGSKECIVCVCVCGLVYTHESVSVYVCIIDKDTK